MSAATPRFAELQRRAAGIGAAALALSLLGAWIDPSQFYQSWLLSFLFWLALPLGSFGFVCLHNMTGGAWGFVIRRILESAAATTPLLLLLFVPVAVGLSDLYPWARPEFVAAHPLVQHKAVFLNVPFFLARAFGYFAIWIVVTRLVTRWSRQQDDGSVPRPRLTRRLQLLSGAGLPIYALTVSFATIDWGMTLEPEWFSTVYGMLFVAGQGLSTLAFAVIALHALAPQPELSAVVKPKHFHDLGNLTLAFVMLWAYLSFSQYLIIWSGNLPEEITWYLARNAGGWQIFGPALIAFHFGLPFLLLLARRGKQSGRRLARLAGWILLMRWIDLFWLVVPAFSPGVMRLHWLDAATFVAIGGLWTAFFARQLGSWPLIPANDPRVAEMTASEAHG